MHSDSPTKILVITCMDRRHTGKLDGKLFDLFGQDTQIYKVSPAGGFGNFASLKGRTDTILMDVDIAVSKLGVTKIVGLIHGSSESDPHGCGAYAVAGFAEEFSTPARSDAFVTRELNAATRFVRNWLAGKGYDHVTVETLSVCFDQDRENILKECHCPEREEKLSSELVAA